ncbi:RNA methyltransferase [Calothrix sp. PCC 6303]|uniref:RNA methyltransferase n=1 Tax=Calothrix sp. PCC 6303 TaxID=1170562 RepID=UPI0002A05738|nr:RNA methyltransferase [Calothrix sp. PCC 6303]AFZ02589.1 RNA methyltransferase, TrmH family, group 1 [Calothrix sp. PCC 6303]
MSLTEVKIILVESAGALNIGSTARVMKNFGFSQLILVNPQCDYLGQGAKMMAVHAQDILESALVVETLPQALKGCKHAIATTGVHHDWNAPLETPRTALPWLLETVGQPAALIFGREDRGLTNQELNYAQRFVRIPTNPAYTSLNLATSVALCCYELSQFADLSPNDDLDSLSGISSRELAPLDVVESYYQQLQSLLLNIGFLHPHTANSRMEKIRQIYNRSQLQTQEIAMLRGMIRQIKWAVEKSSSNENL